MMGPPVCHMGRGRMLGVALGLVLLVHAAQGQSETLWESPTKGIPPELHYAFPKAQCHVLLRSRKIWQSDEYQRAIQALGPVLSGATREWFHRKQLDPRRVERMQFSLFRDHADKLGSTVVLNLRDSVDLPANWQRFKHPDLTGEWYHLPRVAPSHKSAVEETAAWKPLAKETIVVVGRRDSVEAIAQRQSPAPLLRRELNQLRKAADEQHDIVVLVTPQFLRSNIAQFEPPIGRWLATMSPIWDEEVQAIEASLYLSDRSLYAEMRLAGRSESSATWSRHWNMARQQFVESSRKLRPNETESLGPMADRWPKMVQTIHQQLRVTTRANVLHANLSLPSQALHNVVLVAGLWGQPPLQTMEDRWTQGHRDVPREHRPAQMPNADSQAVLRQPEKIASERRSANLKSQDGWVRVLRARISFKFDQLSLDEALAGLQEVVRETVPGGEQFAIRLEGNDLRQAGITRNQQIDNFEAASTPVHAVLTQIVRRADPAVSDPNEWLPYKSSNLVWAALPADTGNSPVDPVKKAAGSPAKPHRGRVEFAPVIVVTTLAGAKVRDFRLPRQFRN